MYATQCTPFLVEKTGAAPDVTYIHCAQSSESAGERTTLALKPMGRITRSPGVISGPTKWILVQQKLKTTTTTTSWCSQTTSAETTAAVPWSGLAVLPCISFRLHLVWLIHSTQSGPFCHCQFNLLIHVFTLTYIPIINRTSKIACEWWVPG